VVYNSKLYKEYLNNENNSSIPLPSKSELLKKSHNGIAY